MSELPNPPAIGYSSSVRSNEHCPKCNGTLIVESGPPDFTKELACINCGNIIYDTTLDKDRARQETSSARKRRLPILPNQTTQLPEEKAARLRSYRQQQGGYRKKTGGARKRTQQRTTWTPPNP